MKGIFLVNAFYKSNEVDKMFEALKIAANDKDIDLIKVDNAANLLRIDLIKSRLTEYDFCIFWNKDILLAKALEMAGLKVFNSSYSIEVCDDKAKTHIALAGVVEMPKTYHFPFTYENTGYTSVGFLKKFEEELGYPYVIKEAFGSLGSGVYLAHSYEESLSITKKCDAKRLIAQEYISTAGQNRYSDIRAYIVGEKCVAAMERYSDEDFRVNVGNGGAFRKYSITDEELDICLKVMKELKLDYAGIDILHSKRGPLLCEVNSNAQFNALSECSGVNVAEQIINYIHERIDHE